MTRGILFDLDETLLDRRATLLNYAADLYEEFHRTVQLERPEFFQLIEELDGRGRAPREQFFVGMSQRAFTGVDVATLEEHFYRCAWLTPVLFPGVVESLESIRQKGIPLGVVTNGRQVSQATKIENSGVGALVDACVISEVIGIRKPDAAIFEHAAGLLRIEPKSSWFVGDDPIADVLGASEAGFRTVWVERHLPWPEQTPRCYDLRASQVREVIDELLGA